MRTSRSNQKKHNSKKSLIIISAMAAIILVAGAAFSVYYFTNRDTVFLGDGQQSDYNNDKKETVIENDGTPVNDSIEKGDGSSDNYTPPTTNDGIGLTAEKSGNSVVVRTTLSGYSDGTCTLSVTNGSQTYEESAEVIYTPEQSLCAGFDIPVSRVGTGAWRLTLTVVSGGVTTTKAITYEVAP